MPEDNGQDTAPGPTTIVQKAGEYAVQIAQNFGQVIFKYSVFGDVRQVVVFFLLVTALGLGIAYTVWLAAQPVVMDGDFNIAVSRFVEVTNTSELAIAEGVSEVIFSFLDDEYKLAFEDVQVNYYDEIEPQGAEEAKALAEKVNAHLVIYGNVTVIGDEALIAPKFYVTEAFQADVGEMSGQHSLELPVRFQVSDLLDTNSEVRARLPGRMAIITEFTKGLVYFVADDLMSSTEAMENAIAYVRDYGRFSGAEVIYLLASNNARLQDDFSLSQQYLDEAFHLNPDYGRAYIAQGNIYYDQLDFFNAAETYQKAISLEEQPYGAYIVEKASLNLGHIFGFQYQEANDNPLAEEAEKDELAQAALDAYQRVIDSYNNYPKPAPRLRDMAAWAYYGTGIIYQEQKRPTDAGMAYEPVLELSEDPDLRERAKRRLNEVLPGG